MKGNANANNNNLADLMMPVITEVSLLV